jgi:hypothetical protein
MPTALIKLSRLALPALCVLALCAAQTNPAVAQVPATGTYYDPYNGLTLSYYSGADPAYLPDPAQPSVLVPVPYEVYYDPTAGNVPAITTLGPTGGTGAVFFYTYGPDLLHDYIADPGGSVIVSSEYDALTQYVNTDLSQTDHTYSTTLDALLNGHSVFDMTFALPYSDPTVQAAVTQADALLAAYGASPSIPGLTSTLLTSLGSQTETVQTGESNDGTGELLGSGLEQGVLSTTTTFGPATIGPNPSGPFPGVYVGNIGDGNPNSVLYIPAGQTDVNIDDTLTTTIDQTVITTNTDLLTQTYDIVGTPHAAPAVPEASDLALLALGLLPLGLIVHAKRRQKTD